MSNIFQTFLKGFKLKKLVVEPKTAQPVKPIEGAKKFLFLLERLFNWSRLNLNRSRSGQGPVEVQLRGGRGRMVTCQALNANS